MAEETPVTPPAPNANPGDKGGNPVGSPKPDPKTTGTADEQFDINKLGKEAWDQIFQHDRFKQLNEKAKTADKLLKEKSDAEEAALKEQGKWQELAQKADQEVDRWKQSSIAAEIKAQAAKLGAVDLDAVALLADKAGVNIDESGNITGAEDAVKQLVDSKPYLFNNDKTSPRVGSGTNPGNPENNGIPKFTHSQIKDPKFFKEHEADIMTAFRTGQITEDLA